MNIVYIITETGKTYTDEGLNMVTKLISNYHTRNIDAPFIFNQGSDFNDIHNFIASVTNDLSNGDAVFVAGSFSNGLMILPVDNKRLTTIKECIVEYHQRTNEYPSTWSFMKVLHETPKQG